MKDSGKYRVTFDADFEQVIRECALQKRLDKNSPAHNWITPTHIEEFIKLHKAGRAHSVEVWEGDRMVAGMYGVFVNGYFSGESMFHKVSDVSKLAFEAQIERMRANGHLFIDTQQVVENGLTQKWGAQWISREEFHARLRQAKAANRPF